MLIQNYRPNAAQRNNGTGAGSERTARHLPLTHLNVRKIKKDYDNLLTIYRKYDNMVSESGGIL